MMKKIQSELRFYLICLLSPITLTFGLLTWIVWVGWVILDLMIIDKIKTKLAARQVRQSEPSD